MIELTDVSFAYSKNGFGLENISLRVEPEIRLGIIGPSGSGKSTLLKVIGGHEKLSSGSIRLNEREIAQLEPGHRGVVTVFQDHALFPHLTVYENVEFPLTVQRVLKKERPAMVEESLRRFGIDHRRNSRPGDLSGGEKQRAALARALIMKPAVLLLDEPTASLDVAQKNELALLLNESERWNVVPTIIMVTHDHEFALSLCHRLAIMKKGRLIAHDKTEDLILRPPCAGAARVLDGHNILIGRFDEKLEFQSKEGGVTLQVPEKYRDFQGSECAVLLRSEEIEVNGLGGPGRNGWQGSIEAVQFRGSYTRLRVRVGDQCVSCDVPRREVAQHAPAGWKLRQKVSLAFDTKDVHVVQAEPTDRPDEDTGLQSSS